MLARRVIPRAYKKLTYGNRIALLSRAFFRDTLRTRKMSAILETTSPPGVFSRAEIQTDRHPEMEACRRLAHKAAVIAGGSTSSGLAKAKRCVQEGMDHVFIKGRRKAAPDVAVSEASESGSGSARKKLHKGENHGNDSR
jgi:hypothetical protein